MTTDRWCLGWGRDPHVTDDAEDRGDGKQLCLACWTKMQRKEPW